MECLSEESGIIPGQPPGRCRAPHARCKAMVWARHNGRMQLHINGQWQQPPEDQAPLLEPDMPLLWALRDVFGLTSVKYGCGVAACGACTVRLDGRAVRSCVIPLAAVQGRRIQTVEGLGTPERPHPLQAAWLQQQVAQCGYCQTGMLMAAAALLGEQARPTDAQIDAAISNLCRCGTYQRVRVAIRLASGQLAQAPGSDVP